MQKNLFFSDVTKAEFVDTMLLMSSDDNVIYVAHQDENGEYRLFCKKESNLFKAHIWLHIYPANPSCFFQEADTCKEHLEADSAEALYDLLKQWHDASEL